MLTYTIIISIILYIIMGYFVGYKLDREDNYVIAIGSMFWPIVIICRFVYVIIFYIFIEDWDD